MSLEQLTKAHLLYDGRDLRTSHGGEVIHGDIGKFETGIMADIPPGHVGLILDRSSLASRGVKVMGGVVDAGYTGEIIVMLANLVYEPVKIEHGDKIAQLVVLPLSAYTPGVASERGDSGFGSTGR